MRSDLLRSGTLRLEGKAGADPPPRVEARLRQALADQELLEPARLEGWQAWLATRLGVAPEVVLVGAHPMSFPLIVPDGIELALVWELEQPLVTGPEPGRGRLALGWTFTVAILGDLAATQPDADRVERLATATLAGYLAGILREEFGWELDPAAEALLRVE